MAIEWSDGEPQPGIADVLLEGFGGSGEKYIVWHGTVLVNPDAAETRWVAMGWPEPDTDRLPHFESRDEAIALCERWEEIKLDAERRARAEFKANRTGEGVD